MSVSAWCVYIQWCLTFMQNKVGTFQRRVVVGGTGLEESWWRQAVVYQIYPRSFKDSDGDGLGDLRGVIDKIPYLKSLGIDAVWLSPFYPSTLADGGYDVIDYRSVDPRLGTIDDFDMMAHALHEVGLKLIVDIVPNHTSYLHPWFQEALSAGRGSDERGRYIFREGRGDRGELPPNDWQSLFGGSAWEQVEDGQWYLHIFTKEQPDLNWKDSRVHIDFQRILRFWSDHGADGFRIDVAHGLAKDLDNMPLDQMDPGAVENVLSDNGRSPLWDRDEVHDIYREWRTVFNEYDPPRFAVGEAWVVPEHQHRYASPSELGQVFNFEFAKANWNREEFAAAICQGMDAADRSRSSATWVMSNHDVPRHASRYGLPQVNSADYHQLAKDWILRDGHSYQEDRLLGTRRARAAILIELALPGSAYIYQGEELGLFEVPDIPWDRLEDPTAYRSSGSSVSKGRDGCRVPLPWSSKDQPRPALWDTTFGQNGSFGFSPVSKKDGSPSEDPHLPQPLWFKDYCVDLEEGEGSSMLNLYRRALVLRSQWLRKKLRTELTIIESDDSVLAFMRKDTSGPGGLICMTNFGIEPAPVRNLSVALSSDSIQDGMIPSDTTLWSRF